MAQTPKTPNKTSTKPALRKRVYIRRKKPSPTTQGNASDVQGATQSASDTPKKKPATRKRAIAKRAKTTETGKPIKTSPTEFERRVAEEYLIHSNKGKAYRDAGGTAKDPFNAGYEVLRKPEVWAYYELLCEERKARTNITADDVLRYWAELAMADPNELIEYRRGACRHCHGVGHAFQWRNAEEYQKACDQEEAAALKDDRDPQLPDNTGGLGFRRNATPHPDCPECEGDGEPRAYVHDSRHVSPSSRRLYNGVKITKDGIEVKLLDRDKALENLGRALGLHRVDLNHDIKEGSPLQRLIQAANGTALKPGDNNR